jgi:hypothetical protein
MASFTPSPLPLPPSRGLDISRPNPRICQNIPSKREAMRRRLKEEERVEEEREIEERERVRVRVRVREEDELRRRLRDRLRLRGDLNQEEPEGEDSAFFSASETFAKQGEGDLLRSDEAMRDNVCTYTE